MSTTPTPVPTPPVLNPTIAVINNDVLTYTPAVIAGVQAAEASNAAGGTKQEAVVNAILGSTGALESNPNPNVAAIAGLTNLVVSIFSALGIFKHKSATATPAPTPAVAVHGA